MLWTQASALDFGVNIHRGGSADLNSQRATIMNQRNFKTARMDLVWNEDQTQMRDQAIKIRANGGRVEAVLWTSAGNDHSCPQDLAAVESRAYSEAYAMVNAHKDLIQDFELFNEVQLRSEILAETIWNSIGLKTSPYESKPCIATMTAAMRGQSRAIRDLRNSSGLPLRAILGQVGRDWGFLTFMQQKGVIFDVIGWHVYQSVYSPSMLNDAWWGPGGPYATLATFGKPVHINEFNCGEIYEAGYENEVGQPVTENCLKALKNHMTDLLNQKFVNVESVHVYELLDAPEKAAPENRFGLMFNLTRNKPHMYLYTAFAGGSLTTQERYEVTSRRLMTDTEIDVRKVIPVVPVPPVPPVPPVVPVVPVVPDTQAPFVTITNPASGSVFARRSTINVTATATDNVGVREVRISLNGALVCVSTSPPYQCQMRLANSKNWTGLIYMQAFDAAGNIGSRSIMTFTN
ncbi:Fibronectin type III domain protein [Polaromonas sp. CG9_12]|nr:Fibronectin type III domain protein [Polaromonas sp. CG9_12]